MAKELTELTKVELLAMAEKKKLSVTKAMKKDEIIVAIEKAIAESAKAKKSSGPASRVKVSGPGFAKAVVSTQSAPAKAVKAVASAVKTPVVTSVKDKSKDKAAVKGISRTTAAINEKAVKAVKKEEKNVKAVKRGEPVIEKKTVESLKPAASRKTAKADITPEPAAAKKTAKAITGKSVNKSTETPASLPSPPQPESSKIKTDSRKPATVEVATAKKPVKAESPIVAAGPPPKRGVVETVVMPTAATKGKVEAKPVAALPVKPVVEEKLVKVVAPKTEKSESPVEKAAKPVVNTSTTVEQTKKSDSGTEQPTAQPKATAPVSPSPRHSAVARTAAPASNGPITAKEKTSAISGNNNNKKRTWDLKAEGSKFFIAREEEDYGGKTESASELPETYGETRMVALVRDPYKLYLYWELDGAAVETARARLGKDWSRLRWVIRIFDITGIVFDGTNAHRSFDIETDPATTGKYVDVDRPDCEYIASIGIVDDEGGFVSVAMSNTVRTPRVEPSASFDVSWMAPDDIFQKLYGLSGGHMAGGSSLGGSEMGIPSMEMSSMGVSSFGGVTSMGSMGVSSFGVSSFGASEQVLKEKDRKFFFWLECELIVYGGTEPDADVTMLGKKIALRPDGTFAARFALPDGIHDIPVIATSADRVERREISPTVTRTTRRHDEFLISMEDWKKTE